MIEINYDKCIGCGLCKNACLSDAIRMDNNRPEIDSGCTYCGNCKKVCPVDAIGLEVNKKEEDLKRYSGIWVVVENDSNSNLPRKVSYELLSRARMLADKLDEKVYAVDICKKAELQLFDDLKSVGCNHLILIEDALLEQYNTELYSEILIELVKRYEPSSVLVPGTENGRDLAPRVSAGLGVGLTADCTDLDINENNELVQIRPTYGGNIIASIVSPKHRPQMATVRPNVFRVVKSEEQYDLDIIRPQSVIDTSVSRVRRAGFRPKDIIYRDVTGADIVIIGGYGVGKDNFHLIYELADKLDAAVGATRKAVDEGWAPFEIQIGQTGKMIAADVCICFGVSGSLQHTIGIKGARKVIAVNSDPTAQIFGISDVAILADCNAVIKSMLERI